MHTLTFNLKSHKVHYPQLFVNFWILWTSCFTSAVNLTLILKLFAWYSSTFKVYNTDNNNWFSRQSLHLLDSQINSKHQEENKNLFITFLNNILRSWKEQYYNKTLQNYKSIISPFLIQVRTLWGKILSYWMECKPVESNGYCRKQINLHCSSLSFDILLKYIFKCRKLIKYLSHQWKYFDL